MKPYESCRAALLEMRTLTVELPMATVWVKPVNELSLQIAAGETLGLVGAQVLLLLQELQKEFHLTDLFISHSLPVAAQLAIHLAVMRAGQLIEYGRASMVLHEPTQPVPNLPAAVPEIPLPGQV